MRRNRTNAPWPGSVPKLPPQEPKLPNTESQYVRSVGGVKAENYVRQSQLIYQQSVAIRCGLLNIWNTELTEAQRAQVKRNLSNTVESTKTALSLLE